MEFSTVCRQQRMTHTAWMNHFKTLIWRMEGTQSDSIEIFEWMCACHNKVWLRRRVYFRYKEENIQLNIFKLQILHWKKKPQKPKQKQKNTTKTLSYVCLPMVSWFTLSNRITALYTVLLCFSDALCLGLMICSSVCIVSIL